MAVLIAAYWRLAKIMLPAARVKIYAFMRTLCHMVFRRIKGYIISAYHALKKNVNGKITRIFQVVDVSSRIYYLM